MLDVLGEVVEEGKGTGTGTGAGPGSVTLEAAIARLQRIRTLRTLLVGFAALGFGLFTGPVLANLYYEERFALDALDRGLLGSLSGIGVALVTPFAGRYYDRLFRRDPKRALRLVGMLIMPVSIVVPIQYSMPTALSFALVGVVPGVLFMTAFAMVGPILQSVVPYRLRGMGFAVATLHMFFVGATGGALVSALITDALGPRGTILILIIPTTIAGGALITRSASFIRHDLSLVVAELREELADHRRRVESPESVPAIQVHDIDFSYGQMQVLFDVGFEVRRGEVLALLGTNGAGKSTILRVIAGLGTPSRGVVRHDGRTITYVAPERRVRDGIQLLAGGQGVFPLMTTAKNLEMAAYVHRSDPADRDRRIERVLALFPDLADRQDQPAGVPVGRTAADAGPGHDPAARARRAVDRRAVAGAVPSGRA